jgi:hypothetical protein
MFTVLVCNSVAYDRQLDACFVIRNFSLSGNTNINVLARSQKEVTKMSLSAVTRVCYVFCREEFYNLCQHIPVLVNIGWHSHVFYMTTYLCSCADLACDLFSVHQSNRCLKWNTIYIWQSVSVDLAVLEIIKQKWSLCCRNSTNWRQ